MAARPLVRKLLPTACFIKELPNSSTHIECALEILRIKHTCFYSQEHIGMLLFESFLMRQAVGNVPTSKEHVQSLCAKHINKV